MVDDEDADPLDAERLVCSFCGRDQHAVKKLVNGPSAVICDECIHAFNQAVRLSAPPPFGASLRDDRSWACAFCGDRPGNVPGVVVRNGAAICSECLSLTADIVAEDW